MAELPTIDSLAKLMTDRQGVWYAVQSTKLIPVPNAPPLADQLATNAAAAWVKNPSPQNQLAAQNAAVVSQHAGPGGWAAQAVAWAKPAAPPAVGSVATTAASLATVTSPAAAASTVATALPDSPNLVTHAVVGSVKLSAAMASGEKLPPPADFTALAAKAAPPTAPAIPAVPTLPSMPAAPKAPAMPAAPAAPAVPTAATATSAATPALLAKATKAQQPFIQLGLDILSGKHALP